MISEITIEEKKYVLLPKSEFEEILKEKLHSKFEGRLFSIDEARKKSEDLILKWAKLK